MISSMTGFGRGTATAGGTTATVEVRSVNKRFIDVSVRAPKALAEREAAVQAVFKEAFERGRFTVHVQLDEEREAALPIAVDEDAAAAYARLLQNLKTAADLDEPVRLEHLLQFSDVFSNVEKQTEADEDTWAAVERALREAAAQLRAMRRREGENLHADLSARIDALDAALEAVEDRAPERVAEARTRLRERLEEIFEDERVRDDRLEAEIAYTVDKLDISEECVRLRSHLELFREALASDEAVGRKLKFLVQEIHREVNTIGSKSNDATIAHRAVQMKEEVEKLREQIENVE